MGTALARTGLAGTVLLAGTALLAAGCGSAGPARPARSARQSPPVITRGVAVREPAADPRPYGAADTAFGLDVLRAWCRDKPTANIVLSPESLASGLGMAYLGARGGTARAMARVLHLPAAGPALLAGLQARSSAVHALGRSGVTLAQSDQVWADPALTTRRGYLDNVATGYGAGVRRVPLLTRPDRAIGQIDAVISGATRGHIPWLLAPGGLQGSGWVLTDALYLKAAWARTFESALTSPGEFTTAAGHRVSVRYLNGEGYRSDRADGWTAVALPYRGSRLSMVALLPDSAAAGSGGPSPASCPGLSAADLSKITKGLAGVGIGRVRISLPKVNLSTKANMKGLLGGLGMGVAFGPAANFAGLSPQADFIAMVVHAATLRVGEKGTVASAATAVGLVPTAAEPARDVVSFDRPYVLLVTDTVTGEPLFLARVADPAAP
jgi:serine protease inhibitor